MPPSRASSPAPVTTSSPSTWFTVTPYFKQCGPPALVEAFPPIVDTIWLDGSGAKKYPRSRTAFESQTLMSPACTVAERFARSISRISFIRVVEIMIPPSGAVAPPMRPVPDPRGITATRSRRQSRTSSITWAVVRGRATSSGVPL